MRTLFSSPSDSVRDPALLFLHYQIKLSYPGEVALQTGLTCLAGCTIPWQESDLTQPNVQ